MHTITRLAALTLSLAAAGSAWAEGPVGALGAMPQATESTLTRAEVVAQVLQARAAGTLGIPEAEGARRSPRTSVVSREAVRARTLEAIARGEAQALGAETNAFSGPVAHGRMAAGQAAAVGNAGRM